MYQANFFSFFFIQGYTFYLLIFLWTDTKLIVNPGEKTQEYHDNESENINGESMGGAALINFFVPDAALKDVRANCLCATLLHFRSHISRAIT